MGAVSIAKTIAKWLEKGYPEEVAERIASGALPMDDASRAARAAEQGYGDVSGSQQQEEPGDQFTGHVDDGQPLHRPDLR